MSTVTRPAAKSSRPARPFDCAMGPGADGEDVVTINGTAYYLDRIPAGECGTDAYTLEKRADGTRYAVLRTHAGLVECDCPDYETRHRHIDTGTCKHGRALVELGLLPGVEPVTPAEGLARYARQLVREWAQLDDRNVSGVLETGRRIEQVCGLLYEYDPAAARAITAEMERADRERAYSTLDAIEHEDAREAAWEAAWEAERSGQAFPD